MSLSNKQRLRVARARRTRARMHGTAVCPRLSVFRSAKHFSAQLIDDDAGRTLTAVSDKGVTAENPTALAEMLGGKMAQQAKEMNVGCVVFDRGAYAYHGLVKAFAEAARSAGLIF
ncbi:MAG: 50S ribosomal protein L18 [Patescibacteria group bacterium]